MKSLVVVDMAGMVVGKSISASTAGSTINKRNKLKKQHQQQQQQRDDEECEEESTNPSTSAKIPNTRVDSIASATTTPPPTTAPPVSSQWAAKAQTSEPGESKPPSNMSDSAAYALDSIHPGTASPTGSQYEEMRKLLTDQPPSSPLSEEECVPLRFPLVVPTTNSRILETHPARSEDVICHTTGSSTSTASTIDNGLTKAANTTTNLCAGSTQLLLERLLQAEAQTRQFQQEIQALAAILRSKESLLVQPVLPQQQQEPRQITITDIHQQEQQQERQPRAMSRINSDSPPTSNCELPKFPPPPPPKPDNLTAASNTAAVVALLGNSSSDHNTFSVTATTAPPLLSRVMRHPSSFGANSILEEEKPIYSGVTATEDDTIEDVKEDDSPGAATPAIDDHHSVCGAWVPWLDTIGEYLGWTPPPVGTVAGLRVDQFKQDQAQKQKVRDLEQENQSLRKTLRVVQTKTTTMLPPHPLTPVRRSCPGRVKVEGDDSGTLLDKSFGVPSFMIKTNDKTLITNEDCSTTTAAALSNITPDAVVAVSVLSNSSTVRQANIRTAQPRTVSTTSSLSLATTAQGSHLESVPENEELSSLSPPLTPTTNNSTTDPPSDGTPKRKYSLSELRQRSKQIRARSASRSSSSSKSRTTKSNATTTTTLSTTRPSKPVDARESSCSVVDNKQQQCRGRSCCSNRGSRNKDVPVVGSKWRMAFLERIEL